LAAIDAVTGQATPWNPNSNGQINTLAFSDNILYIGGNFTSVSGANRNNLAAIDVTSGQATTWNPDPNTSIYNIGIQSLAISGSTVYAAGDFTFIGGQNRIKLASIHTSTGLATAWNPNPNEDGYITTLAVSDNKVYVGGSFYSIGNQQRNCLASFDILTGQITPWNPNLLTDEGVPQTLAIANNRVYAGGNFIPAGVSDKYHLAAVDATTGKNLSWYPNPTGGIGYVMKLAVSEDIIYTSGFFRSIDTAGEFKYKNYMKIY
jgi:hypothetical protein